MDDQIEAFREHLEQVRRLSPMTVKSYVEDLTDFSRFLEESGGLPASAGTIEVRTIRQYLGVLQARGYEKSTLARRLSCLRTFFRYLVGRGAIAADPTVGVRAPRLGQRLPRWPGRS